MTEYMRTWVEVFPVAATADGIWLLSGSAPWRSSDAVPADKTPWWVMEEVLLEHNIRPSRNSTQGKNMLLTAVANHQSSDRWPLGQGQTDTFVSILPDGTVLPGALPISLPAVEGMGRPEPHAADEEPDVITAAGVLLHTLRHVRFLSLFDGTYRRDLPPLLAGHLEVLQPALAGLYEDEHQAAA
jgi:hypothetical protein